MNRKKQRYFCQQIKSTTYNKVKIYMIILHKKSVKYLYKNQVKNSFYKLVGKELFAFILFPKDTRTVDYYRGSKIKTNNTDE